MTLDRTANFQIQTTPRTRRPPHCQIEEWCKKEKKYKSIILWVVQN